MKTKTTEDQRFDEIAKEVSDTAELITIVLAENKIPHYISLLTLISLTGYELNNRQPIGPKQEGLRGLLRDAARVIIHHRIEQEKSMLKS